jgi:hypothetical protein
LSRLSCSVWSDVWLFAWGFGCCVCREKPCVDFDKVDSFVGELKGSSARWGSFLHLLFDVHMCFYSSVGAMVAVGGTNRILNSNRLEGGGFIVKSLVILGENYHPFDLCRFLGSRPG